MSILNSRFAVCTAMSIALFALTACGGGDDSSTPAQSTSSTAPATQTATTSPATQQSAPAPAPTPAPAPAPATVAGTASLQWVAPQANTDGSALQDLAGYTVVYGKTQNNLDQSLRIDNPSLDRFVVEQLPAGTYYFAVKAFNSAGAESALSNIVTKVIS